MASPGQAALRQAADRNKADLDSLIQGSSDPAQHCQRVTFVVRVEAANDRLAGWAESLRLHEHENIVLLDTSQFNY